MSSARLSPQTPPSVLKLRELKFCIQIFHANAKNLPTGFLKFCLGAEIRGSF